MAISSRKISGLKELSNLSGDEFLMVAFNNRSYKVKTSLFTSDIIESIEQDVRETDSHGTKNRCHPEHRPESDGEGARSLQDKA